LFSLSFEASLKMREKDEYMQADELVQLRVEAQHEFDQEMLSRDEGGRIPIKERAQDAVRRIGSRWLTAGVLDNTDFVLDSLCKGALSTHARFSVHYRPLPHTIVHCHTLHATDLSVFLDDTGLDVINEAMENITAPQAARMRAGVWKATSKTDAAPVIKAAVESMSESQVLDLPIIAWEAAVRARAGAKIVSAVAGLSPAVIAMLDKTGYGIPFRQAVIQVGRRQGGELNTWLDKMILWLDAKQMAGAAQEAVQDEGFTYPARVLTWVAKQDSTEAELVMDSAMQDLINGKTPRAGTGVATVAARGGGERGETVMDSATQDLTKGKKPRAGTGVAAVAARGGGRGGGERFDAVDKSIVTDMKACTHITAGAAAAREVAIAPGESQAYLEGVLKKEGVAVFVQRWSADVLAGLVLGLSLSEPWGKGLAVHQLARYTSQLLTVLRSTTKQTRLFIELCRQVCITTPRGIDKFGMVSANDYISSAVDAIELVLLKFADGPLIAEAAVRVQAKCVVANINSTSVAAGGGNRLAVLQTQKKSIISNSQIDELIIRNFERLGPTKTLAQLSGLHTEELTANWVTNRWIRLTELAEKKPAAKKPAAKKAAAKKPAAKAKATVKKAAGKTKASPRSSGRSPRGRK
jgi:hypothetical protein